MEALADEQLLALVDSQFTSEQQAKLSELLAKNREGELEAQQFDHLMTLYRQGLIRKAEATKEAVARGLIPPLTQ